MIDELKVATHIYSRRAAPKLNQFYVPPKNKTKRWNKNGQVYMNEITRKEENVTRKEDVIVSTRGGKEES